MGKLARDFYLRDTCEVAKELLGKILVHETGRGMLRARIVETEAYRGVIDKASHAFGGKRTKRVEVLYGPGGFAYVYLIYGMYHCMNVVTRDEGVPECVLLRALEPLEGTDIMMECRGTRDIKKLCSGPGKLCMAMGMDMLTNGEDLCGPELYIEDAPALPEERIVSSKRINIDYAGEARDYPWRYMIRDNPFVSVREKKA